MSEGKRRAIVTGGSSGIGEQIVLALEAAGVEVTVLDLKPPPASASGFVECDVADERSVVAAVAASVERLGGLELAFLNAGIGGVGAVVDLSAEEWDRMQAVDLRGVFLTMREAGRAMIAAGGGGSIVVTSSICGNLADRRMAHYNAAKAGAQALVRVAAAEMGRHGVRVNAIQPGVTATPMSATTETTLPGYREAVAARTPLGDIGDPAHVAEAAVALAGLVWVTGQVLAADGGVSLYSPIDIEDHLPTGAGQTWTAEAGGVVRSG